VRLRRLIEGAPVRRQRQPDPAHRRAEHKYGLSIRSTQPENLRGFGYDGTNYESTINYTWDGGDRLTQVVDSIAGTITRAYDGLDRLSSETAPQGAVGYGYDNAGRRISMTVAGQTGVTYSYDDANRLTGITQGLAGVSFAYDNANRRTNLTLPNGVTVAYTYDSDSHVTGLAYTMAGAQIGNLTYAYDADGRATSKSGSLETVVLPQAVSGNIFNADNEMTQFGLQTLAYDANGNLTSDGTNAYSWDARNHLSAISGTVSASFTYDALGRRAGKTIGGATRQFVYDRLNSRPGVGWSQPTQHHGEPAHRTGN
jgi:YD repeat-containing protein